MSEQSRPVVTGGWKLKPATSKGAIFKIVNPQGVVALLPMREDINVIATLLASAPELLAVAQDLADMAQALAKENETLRGFKIPEITDSIARSCALLQTF